MRINITGCLLAFAMYGASTYPLKAEQPVTPYSNQQEISDADATAFALKALAARGSKPDFTKTEILRHIPGSISVTFIKPIPADTLGSDKIVTVIIDSRTGKFISWHGY